jgi:hypothetical protein
MNEVPTIGGARGVFEIFVPGVFLLVNIVGAIYLFPWMSPEIIGSLNRLAANTAAAIVITVCFGYLCGVILRVQRADLADSVSAWWNRHFNPRAKRPQGGDETYWSWATDDLPFIRWIGEMSDIYLPSEVQQYYSKEWRRRLPNAKITNMNKQFFNLCKIAISEDRNLAAEVYTAEALTRYVACMFYALLVASVLAAGTAVLNLAYAFVAKASFAATIGAGVACTVYLLAAWLIIKNLRFVRIKEVETLFYACYGKSLRMSDSDLQGRSTAAN